jgi:hypothetical protein
MDLDRNQVRLAKILKGLATEPELTVEADAEELRSVTAALRDLRSEARWIKNFEELTDSRLLHLYRGLKHHLGEKIFHPAILPLVVEANFAFKKKIAELIEIEESRIFEQYQRLARSRRTQPQGPADLDESLAQLQALLQDFGSRTRVDEIRLEQLAELGKSMREVSIQFEKQATPPVSAANGSVSAPAPVVGAARARDKGSVLVPDLEKLQPEWDELFAALSHSDVGGHTGGEAAESILRYRLEPREVTAFQRISGRRDCDLGLEQFVLAGAALRDRSTRVVLEIQNLLSGSVKSGTEAALDEARQTAKMADAFVHHYLHLVDQAVWEGDGEQARTYQRLQVRLSRVLSGLLIVIPRLSSLAVARPSPAAEKKGSDLEDTLDLNLEAAEARSLGDGS